MALVPAHYLDAVVAIGDRENFTHGFGTGFVYGQLVKENEEKKTRQFSLFLVTNRHVLEDRTNIWLRFNTQGGQPAKYFPLDLMRNGTKIWKGHLNKEVDLAAFGLNADYMKEQGIELAFFASHSNVMGVEQALEEGLSEGDGVFVLGYPLGAIGQGRNYAIVRQGCVARIRDFVKDQTTSFLIDANVFPGNSGGPVLVSPAVYGVGNTKFIKRCVLVGVVSGYLGYQERLVSEQTGRFHMLLQENAGLAEVVPIDYLDSIIAQL